MDHTLYEKVKNIKSADYITFHNFVCNLGISDDVTFLDDDYKQYFKSDGYRLYFSPVVLAEVLLRLKSFIGINTFNYYINYEPIEYDYNLFDLYEAFLKCVSIKPIECTILDTPKECDISYICDGMSISTIENILNLTKNVIIIENLYNTDIIDYIQQKKKDYVISYYMHPNADNPKSSVAILYKNLEMFD